MNKVIDKGFRSCRFISTIVKYPVFVCSLLLRCMFEVWRVACGNEVNSINSGTIYFRDASLDILVHSSFM